MESKTGWSKVRFDEICKNISDRVDDPKKSGTDYYIGLEHLDSEDLAIRRHGTPDDVNATKLRFKKGQILFGKRRFYQRKLAVANRDGICSAHMLVLEPIEGKIVKQFLPILMQSEEFFERSMMISEGSLSPTIKWKNLAKQEFFIPTKTEQANIIVLLNKTDSLLSKTQNLVEKYQIFRNSIADKLLTKGIGHTKFKKVKSLYRNYEKIPEEWEIKTFNDLFEFLRTGTNSRDDLRINGDVHYIHYGDIHAKWNSILDCELEKIPCIDKDKVEKLPLLKDGDLIIVDASEDYEGSGTSVLLKNVNNKKIVSGLHTIALRNIDQNILSDFKTYLTSIRFVKSQIIAYVTGISVYGLSKNNLKKIRIPLPTLLEQQKIVSILSEIDDNINKLTTYISTLKMMKKSILSEKLVPKKSEVKILVQ